MSIAIKSVRMVGVVAVVHVLPQSSSEALAAVDACFVALQEDLATRAVAVVSDAEDFSAESTPPSTDAPTISPKTLGLVKPFGVGLRGRVFDYGLRLVAEADVVVATDDVRLVDASLRQGHEAVHAGWLSAMLPSTEVARLALLGVVDGLTVVRATELGIVDEVVDPTMIEPILVDRLGRLCGH
jgi:hypothetical protein